jgi:hypothetical protein
MREIILQKMVLNLQDIIEKENALIEEYGENSSEVNKIKNRKNLLYEKIEKRYNLQKRIYTWSKSYGGFFDSYEDFLLLCKKVFYESLLTYKTLDERIKENKAAYERGEIKKSQIKPKGNGEINTYFAYCLSNELVNYYNSTQALCRNPKVRCPICFELVAPLKKHLKEDHEEYVMKAWRKKWNKDMNEFSNCPICGYNTRDLFDHVVTRHPNIIYDLFRVEYPQYMLSEKPYSLDFEYTDNDEDNGNTLADILYNEDENTMVEHLRYKKLVKEIKNNIKNDEELKLFQYMLDGYTRSEICEETDWSHKKYAQIRSSLIRNNRIKEILEVN